MDTKKVLLIIGILLNIISSLLLIFGYRIRELWPTTITMYEIGIPVIIGILGVTFFSLAGTLFTISLAKKKNIE
jgi:amino acid transporter